MTRERYAALSLGERAALRAHYERTLFEQVEADFGPGVSDSLVEREIAELYAEWLTSDDADTALSAIR